MAYRIVVHDIPTDLAAHKLVVRMMDSGVRYPVTIEPDDVETAQAELDAQVSLRKDTPASATRL
jgi:hypothetical protein